MPTTCNPLLAALPVTPMNTTTPGIPQVDHLQGQVVALAQNQQQQAESIQQLAEDLKEVNRQTNSAIQATNRSIVDLGTAINNRIDTQQATLLAAIEKKRDQDAARDDNRQRGIMPMLLGSIGVATGVLTVYISAQTSPLKTQVDSLQSAMVGHADAASAKYHQLDEQVAGLRADRAADKVWHDCFEKWVLPRLWPGQHQ